MKTRASVKAKTGSPDDKKTTLKAARLAASKATVELFDILRKTKGSEAKEEMFRIIEPFAISGYPPAMTRLSICYREGYGVEKDLEKAIEWMGKVADTGSEASACKLFDLLLEQDPKANRDRMFSAIEPYGETGKEPARMRYALSFLYGYGVEKDVKKAMSIIVGPKIVRKEFRPTTTPLLMIYPLNPKYANVLDKQNNIVEGTDVYTEEDTPFIGFAISFPHTDSTIAISYAINQSLGVDFADTEEYFEENNDNEYDE